MEGLELPAEMPVFVDYGQIFVMVPDVPRAGLIWTEEHVRQGFAWAPGIVAFGVHDADGFDLIRVAVADEAPVAADALWAVQVPFAVKGEGVEIGTVGLCEPVRVPAGRYALVFQAIPAVGLMAEEGEPYRRVLSLVFRPEAEPGFAVLRRGAVLEADRVLSVTAEYA